MTLCALVLSLLSATGQADTHETGTVTRIYIDANSNINFWLSAGCKTSDGQTGYYQFPLASEKSRAWYALLLNAATSRLPVKVAYAGSCIDGQHILVSYVYQDY